MDAVSLLFALLKLTALVMAVTSSSGQTCSRSYVNGQWISSGNCEDESSLENIMKDLKKRAERENAETPQRGPSTASDSDGNLPKTHFHLDEIQHRACNISRFTFTNEPHLDYIRYNGRIPNMTSFTLCFWVRLTNDTDKKVTIVSYCVLDDPSCNTFVVWLIKDHIVVRHSTTKVRETSNGQSDVITNRYKYRTHICIVKSRVSLSLSINASQYKSKTILPAPLEGGGVLILGQNLDGRRRGESSLTPWHAEQGFRGDVEGFQLWNDSLSYGDIEALYQSGKWDSYDDAELIITLKKSNSVLTGDVIANWNVTCAKP